MWGSTKERALNYYECIQFRLQHYFTDNDRLFGSLFLVNPELNHDVCLLIRYRLTTIHSLWKQTSHPTGVAHWINWWFSAHMPGYLFAKRNATPTSVVTLYRKQIAPEYYTKRRPIFYADFSTIESEIRLAWHLDPDGPVNCAIEKLLKKGAFAPTSIRYGEGQLKKCSRSSGPVRDIARAIAVTHLLKLCIFDSEVVSFEYHAEVAAMTAEEAVTAMCESGTSRLLYAAITRFIIAATMAVTPIYAAVWSNPEYRKHMQRVVSGSQVSPSRHIYTPLAMWQALVKAIRIRKKVPVTVQEQLSRKEIAFIYTTVMTRPVFGPHIPVELLRRATLTEVSIALLCTIGKNKKMMSAKALRALICNLNELDRAKLYVVVFSVQMQGLVPRLFNLSPVAARIQRQRCLKENGTNVYLGFICRRCFLFRSHIKRNLERRLDNPEKSRAGVIVAENGPICFNCGSDSVATVDLVGRRLRVATRASDIETRDIMLCTECLVPTADAFIMGELPYCKQCFTNAKRGNLGVCMCGAIHGFGTPQALINPDGGLAIYQFCQTHHSLRPDSIVQVPLHLLRLRRGRKRIFGSR